MKNECGRSQKQEPLTLALPKRRTARGERELTRSGCEIYADLNYQVERDFWKSKAPHPSPLPEGEGTDRGDCKAYADMQYRVEHEFWKSKAPHPSPLPEGEGTDRGECECYADLGYRVVRDFQSQSRSAPSPRGEGWGEGRIHHKSKANRPALHHSTISVSSSALDLDLASPATSEG
jgi:hypothetical protein